MVKKGKRSKVEKTNENLIVVILVPSLPAAIERDTDEYYLDIMKDVNGYNPFFSFKELKAFMSKKPDRFINILGHKDIYPLMKNCYRERLNRIQFKNESIAESYLDVTFLDDALKFWEHVITKRISNKLSYSGQEKALKNAVHKRFKNYNDLPPNILLQASSDKCKYHDRCVYLAFINMLCLYPTELPTAEKQIITNEYFTKVDNTLAEYGLNMESLMKRIHPGNMAKPELVTEELILAEAIETVQAKKLADDTVAFEQVWNIFCSSVTRSEFVADTTNNYCENDGSRISINGIRRWLEMDLSPRHGAITLKLVWDNKNGTAKLDKLFDIIANSTDKRYLVIGNNTLIKAKKDDTNEEDSWLSNSHAAAIVTHNNQKILINSDCYNTKRVCLLSREALAYHFPFGLISLHALQMGGKCKLSDLQDVEGKVPWKTIFKV
jgi:hypothetical protein